MRLVLDTIALDEVDAELADTDADLERRYPGDVRRQPVHTVYVPGDRYSADLVADWAAQARALVTQHGGLEALAARLGIADHLAPGVAARVADKLDREPVEDLRVDFEDGYGVRDDEVEDADVVRAATALAQTRGAVLAPPVVGIRLKCFERATRRRGIRTLDLFLATLLAHGDLPETLALTFPKVSTVSQVVAFTGVCERLEAGHGLPAGTLRFEIQVETPHLVLGPDGRLPVAACLDAGGGRVSALHYGTYDYSASVGIAAEHQALDHPAADFAKSVMQVATAGTGVHLSDGSTNVVPVGDGAPAAWDLHYRLVRRSLARGYYQGWDLHPGHLPTRFLATFAFFAEGSDRAAERLRTYLDRRSSGVMDEPATAKALARYLQRGLRCGALDETATGASTGVSADELDRLARLGTLV